MFNTHERESFYGVLKILFDLLELKGSDLKRLSDSMFELADSARGSNKVLGAWLEKNYPNGVDSELLKEYLVDNPKEKLADVIGNTILTNSHLLHRWSKIQENKENRPYLMYRTAGDSRVRTEHQKFDRIILPVNHPFWESHFPFFVLGCRCGVRTISKRELVQKNWLVTTDAKLQSILDTSVTT